LLSPRFQYFFLFFFLRSHALLQASLTRGRRGRRGRRAPRSSDTAGASPPLPSKRSNEGGPDDGKSASVQFIGAICSAQSSVPSASRRRHAFATNIRLWSKGSGKGGGEKCADVNLQTNSLQEKNRIRLENDECRLAGGCCYLRCSSNICD